MVKEDNNNDDEVIWCLIVKLIIVGYILKKKVGLRLTLKWSTSKKNLTTNRDCSGNNEVE